MKRKLTRATSLIVVAAMVLTTFASLVGCGKEEVIEEDKVTVINVTAEELAPEITDEDLGITRKEATELSQIVGYQSWEGYNFLVLRNSGGEGDIETTVQIEDEELFNSLYNARHHIYVDVSYESVTQDDSMYASYAKGLRSLGHDFYELTEKKTVQSESEEILEESVSEQEVENPTDEETTSEETVAENTEPNSEEGSTESDSTTADEKTSSETAETSETVETDETDIVETDAPIEEVVNDDSQLFEENEDSSTLDFEEARIVNEQLKKAIEEYMQSVSLKRATQVLVFALDGELLGEMTPAKLNDYVAAFPINLIPLESTNGVVYVSDMIGGYDYEVKGSLMSEAGDHQYTIKNDTRKPVIIYTYSDTNEKAEYIFENYMETSKSTGWYLVENEYSFSSTDDTYRIRIEHKNSDSDLTHYLPESRVLIIEEIDNEIVEVDSNYSAIVNNTDQDVYIEADTGDCHILGSKQAIGVHKSAYNSIKYYFEGADVNPKEAEEALAENNLTEITSE